MVGLATCDVQEVVAPPFPKWYVEAPTEDSNRGRLLDEVRTALLDYERPDHILGVRFGCVTVMCTNFEQAIPVSEHLVDKGFELMTDARFETWADEVRVLEWPFVLVRKRS